jgi:TatD DNase family protein
MPADRSFPPLPAPLAVPVYDNHTHVDPSSRPGRVEDGLALDYREHLDRASSVGVKGIVQVGTDVESSRWAAEVAAAEPRVLAAVAIHPNDAPGLETRGELDDALAVIDALAGQPRVRAIGETGLDFFRTDEHGRAAQFRSFEAHIELAKRHGLALQIHDRDAHDDVVATLHRVGAPDTVVFHCFSGGPELARLCAEHGWFMSFSGTVTFGNAPLLREALAVAPRSLIMVETDAPYLTPVPYRGRPNAPYLIPTTVRFMAETLGTDEAILAAQIASNTEAVYGMWDDDIRVEA